MWTPKLLVTLPILLRKLDPVPGVRNYKHAHIKWMKNKLQHEAPQPWTHKMREDQITTWSTGTRHNTYLSAYDGNGGNSSSAQITLCRVMSTSATKFTWDTHSCFSNTIHLLFSTWGNQNDDVLWYCYILVFLPSLHKLWLLIGHQGWKIIWKELAWKKEPLISMCNVGKTSASPYMIVSIKK